MTIVLTEEQRESARARARAYYERNREAVIERAARWAAENPERRREIVNASNQKRTRESMRAWCLSKYGMSIDDYNELLDAQGGVCAICRRECATGQSLSVDHDHDTGVIRGLLCRKCNTAIGLLDDDHTIVQMALDYLEHHAD